MEIHFGVLRDKQEIYSGLLQGQSMNRQLAVCYNSDGKLIVKICTVKEMVGGEQGITVVLESSDENQPEFKILLDDIVSIYPIQDFVE